MADAILVLNAGSSSIKFSAFDADSDNLALLLGGQIEGLYTAPRFSAEDADGADIGSKVWGDGVELGHAGAITYLIEFLRDHRGNHKLVAVGHRVVHGGVEFSEAVLVTAEVMSALGKLTPLAPLHQPHNLKPVDIVAKLRPDLLQVACFDTAFHRVQPEAAQAFALPQVVAPSVLTETL